VIDGRVLRDFINSEFYFNARMKLYSTEFTKDMFIREVPCTVPVPM
jgi:hypothetical protein